MENLKVIYRDEGGYVEVEIHYGGIDFLDGEAYFTDGTEDYRIKMESLVRMGKGERSAAEHKNNAIKLLTK